MPLYGLHGVCHVFGLSVRSGTILPRLRCVSTIECVGWLVNEYMGMEWVECNH